MPRVSGCCAGLRCACLEAGLWGARRGSSRSSPSPAASCMHVARMGSECRPVVLWGRLLPAGGAVFLPVTKGLIAVLPHTLSHLEGPGGVHHRVGDPTEHCPAPSILLPLTLRVKVAAGATGITSVFLTARCRADFAGGCRPRGPSECVNKANCGETHLCSTWGGHPCISLPVLWDLWWFARAVFLHFELRVWLASRCGICFTPVVPTGRRVGKLSVRWPYWVAF